MTRSTVLLITLAMTIPPLGCSTPSGSPESITTAQSTPLAVRLRAAARHAPLVVAHRGASATHPENTLTSFRAGLDAGADIVELDFRTTSDGMLVCIHDATVDRTTDSAKRWGRDGVAVESTTAAELFELDAGTWKGPEHLDARIPTLEAALLEIQPRAITMIEHKSGDAASLVDLLRRLDLVDDVLVQSFDWNWLAEVKKLEPRLTLGALGSRRLSPERLAEIDGLGVAMVHWAADHLLLDDIVALHDLGYFVCAYTVDSDLGLAGGIAAGLDAITTDVPARMRTLVARGSVTPPASAR